MKMTKYRLFMAWEHEQEEAWLAEMEADGWHLDTVQMIRYEFVKGEPDQYQYRLEMLPELPNHPDSVRYLEFMEETGAEAIASYLRWVYFRKKTADGPFELFSDNSSRIKMLNRVLSLLTTLGILCLVAGGYNLFLYFLWGHAVSLVGLLPLAVSVLLGLGMRRLQKKKKLLQKEEQVFDA